MTSGPPQHADLRPALRDDLEQVPHGRTAQRLTWRFLPPALRAEVESRLGGAVVADESRESGFSSGFASVLRTARGRSVFLKAASVQAQESTANAYRAEARLLSGLVRHPEPLPMPRPLWVHDDDSWVAIAFEAVRGRPPRRPWTPTDLERALDVAERIADATDPMPDLDLRPVTAVAPTLLVGWDSVPDRPHRDEAAALAESYSELPATAFCHTDLRDDNVLLGADPAGADDVAVDWNQPSLGQPWRDTVDLLVSAYGDGVDVEEVLARRRLTRDVDPDDVDRWLAAVGGYMADASYAPVRPTSPYLRVHARWYAAATWGWLADRRGWH